jgi:hypothetical protein
VTAEEVSRSLALTSEERSLGMTVIEEGSLGTAAAEDGASGIIVKCDCRSEAQ